MNVKDNKDNANSDQNSDDGIDNEDDYDVDYDDNNNNDDNHYYYRSNDSVSVSLVIVLGLKIDKQTKIIRHNILFFQTCCRMTV